MGLIANRICDGYRRYLGKRGPAIGLLLGLLATMAPAPLMADEYRLDTQDRLRIRVVEWQTVEGTFREWSAVSGDYLVGASGNLSLPFLGETPAAGKTTAEIAETISETLQQKFGLSQRPETSVELAEYRPFYVFGDVETPGQYSYAPGLTVIKAMSIAGGLRNSSGQRAERDFLNAKGSYDVLADEKLRLLVKRARLTAEAQGKSSFETPKDLPASPELEAIVADESAVMAARQGRLKRQLEALDSLKQLLESEIDSLEQKSVTQRRQIDLAKKELSDIGSLAEQGLVVNTRILNTERTIADLEGRLLDLETAILRAKQDISQATQDAINLQDGLEADITGERQRVEADLAAAELKIDMNRGLMAEALSVAPALALTDEADVEIVVQRAVDGEVREIAAEETSTVNPGDVIKVRLKLGDATTAVQ